MTDDVGSLGYIHLHGVEFWCIKWAMIYFVNVSSGFPFWDIPGPAKSNTLTQPGDFSLYISLKHSHFGLITTS